MIPNLTCCNYYLFASKEEIFLINIYGNIKYINLTLMQQINDTIIFNGFFSRKYRNILCYSIFYILIKKFKNLLIKNS